MPSGWEKGCAVFAVKFAEKKSASEKKEKNTKNKAAFYNAMQNRAVP
jgi:hypothetical protein